jgi:ubiquinone/menaquinone biosynthesis C-methylase UbiE
MGASNMRVHLGAGDKYWPGWVNVDIEGDQDIISDIMKLPFEENSVDEIQAIHVFEHLHRMDAPRALQEWKRVLKEDGKLVLEMPCLDKILENFNKGEKNIRMTILGIFGDPRYESEYMVHKWCWSKEELTSEMQRNGFIPQITEPNFHFKQRDFRCVAIPTGEH